MSEPIRIRLEIEIPRELEMLAMSFASWLAAHVPAADREAERDTGVGAAQACARPREEPATGPARAEDGPGAPAAPASASPQPDGEGAAKQPRPPAPSEPARKWSGPGSTPLFGPERRAIIERDYPAGVPLTTITARVNALPGPTVTSTQIAGCASVTLHLRRPAAGGAVTPTLVPKRHEGLEATLQARARTEAGSIPITWEEARRLAEMYGFPFTGDMMPILSLRARQNLPRVVLDEAAA